MSDDVFEAGMQVRREMWGPELADMALANATEIGKPFQEMMTRYCFGETWTRPDLSRRDRSMITLAMLINQGKHVEIKMHIKAGITNGLTRAEIREIILHAMIYCGVPASHGGLVAANEAFAELDAAK